MLAKEIEFPLFHLGTYTAQSGAKVEFNEALLRQLERNTNFVLKTRALQPPIGYDHPAADSHAHGILTGARYENGVLYVKGNNWSDTLAADAKDFKRLTYSGEFDPEFKYTDNGAEVNVGPTVIGVAMLGKQRAAIKNPGMKPLSEFGFAEGVSGEALTPADAWFAREELRKAGLVAEDYDGKHFFGEVENDASRFQIDKERQKEPTMTDAEIQALVSNSVSAAVTAATAPLQAKITAQETALATQKQEFGEQLNAMSATTQRKADALSFCEKAFENKTPGKLFKERAEAALSDASFSEPQRNIIKGIIEAAPAAMVKEGLAGKGKSGGNNADDEPDALADLKLKHFGDRDANESRIYAGMVAFGEMKPEAYKGIENNLDAKIEVVRKHVVARDSATQ